MNSITRETIDRDRNDMVNRDAIREFARALNSEYMKSKYTSAGLDAFFKMFFERW